MTDELPGIRRERVWVPMSDGVRLAATLWLPEDASPKDPCPPVLELSPYRMDDVTVDQTHELGCYVARRGICYARVDIRGTGASEGTLPSDQLSEQEMIDGVQVIDWLSSQPWSSGNVGMWGISYTGANTIQVAMRRPPALKAIFAMMCLDDSYRDIYEDGFFSLTSGIHLDQLTMMTGAPDFPLDEASLAARFDRPPWFLNWIREQRDGPFWWRNSLSCDYGAIDVPTYLVGGWFDAYRDSIPRMLEHMTAPVKAVVGPWQHALPHRGSEPRIEWRYEAVRWWDRWLKGQDTGIMDEPRFSVFIRAWHPPGILTEPVPGKWRTEAGWPIARAQEVPLYLGPARQLSPKAPPEEVQRLRYLPSVGSTVPSAWEGFIPDPRPDDAHSLVFESAPLGEDLEILGMVKVELRGSADAPLVHWFARLSDVAPDGTVTAVSGGGLNGAQKESRTHPRPLEPGVVYDFHFEMHCMSWVFSEGHRIRVAVSNALWPSAWPSPYPAVTTLHLGAKHNSRILLPVIPYEHRPIPSFLPPDPCPLPAMKRSFEGDGSLTRKTDGTAIQSASGDEVMELPWGRELKRSEMVFTVNDHRPDRASAHGEAEWIVEIDDRRLAWRSILDVESTQTDFIYRFRRELLQDGLMVRERSWQDRVPRDCQ